MKEKHDLEFKYMKSDRFKLMIPLLDGFTVIYIYMCYDGHWYVCQKEDIGEYEAGYYTYGKTIELFNDISDIKTKKDIRYRYKLLKQQYYGLSNYLWPNLKH